MAHYEEAHRRYDKIEKEVEEMLKEYKELDKKDRRKAYVSLCKKYLNLKYDK